MELRYLTLEQMITIEGGSPYSVGYKWGKIILTECMFLLALIR